MLKVLIDAPMLEHISLEDDFFRSYTLQKISSNVQAKINVGTCYDDDDDPDCPIKLIWGLSSAKYLSISESTMKVSEFILFML